MRTVKAFAQESREMESYRHSIKNVLNLGYLEAKARAIFYGMVGPQQLLILLYRNNCNNKTKPMLFIDWIQWTCYNNICLILWRGHGHFS